MKKSKTKTAKTKKARRKATKSPSVQNMITKEMSFGEVLNMFPQTMPVFSKYGMHCIGCALSSFETLEQGAKAHGIDIKKLVNELNEAAGLKKLSKK